MKIAIIGCGYVGGGYWITMDEPTAYLREITRSASEVMYSDMEKGDAERTLADSSLTRKWVGYRPNTTIEGVLRRYTMWHRRGVEQ